LKFHDHGHHHHHGTGDPEPGATHPCNPYSHPLDARKTADHAQTRRLAGVLALTLAYTVAEVVGGWLSNSLALLADAGHMMTDNAALMLALFAAWFARRPPDPNRTYGYQRAEILAALANGVALVVICLFIFWEAAKRFRSPPEVEYGLMAIVAAGGLAVNLIAAWILHGRHHGLNVRAAYLHVLGDLLGSIGALGAAGLIAAFGWTWADPLASVIIGGIIIFSSTRLVLDSVNVLMEGVPSHLDADEIRRCLLSTPGVVEIHDLHVWSLSGGAPLLTAHLVTDHALRPSDVLKTATRSLRERFGITHATLQLEPPDFNIVSSLSTGRDQKKGGA
jgi:cobalt-zinc-cadmium efflux system protein